jgi:hypothetical protein
MSGQIASSPYAILCLQTIAMPLGTVEPMHVHAHHEGQGTQSPAFTLAVASVAAFPVNRWLIARGRGHAGVHVHH